MSGSRRVGRRLQEGTLYVVLFMLPFSKSAVEVGFGLLLAGWLLEHAGGERPLFLHRRSPVRPVALALAAYVVICGLSWLWSTNPALSIDGWIGKTLEYALFTVFVADVARRPGVATRCGIVLAMSAVVVGLDGAVGQYLGADPLRGMRSHNYQDMQGPYENPIDLAVYLMTVLPIVLAQRWSGPRIVRVARWVIVGFLGWCLIETRAEGNWVALSAGLLFLAVVDRRLRVPIAWAGAAFGAAALVPLVRTGYLASLLTFKTGGIQDRAYMWGTAWEMIKTRPFLGHGLNTFMDNYLAFCVGGERMPRYAHNCYLQIWAETGLAGLAAVGWLLSGMLRLWARAIRMGRDVVERPMLAGTAAGLVAFMLHAVFDTNFYALRHAALFWILAGLACGRASVVLADTGPVGEKGAS
ncbi:MAG TPA: O-antigen ligase family protein [bacterium]